MAGKSVDLVRFFFKDFGALEQEASSQALEYRLLHQGSRPRGLFFPSGPEYPVNVYFPSEWDSAQDIIELARGINNIGVGFAAWIGIPSNLCEDMEGCRNGAHELVEAVAEMVSSAGLPEKLVLMGRSVGASMALDAGVEFQEKVLCLIMESSFVDTWQYLKAQGIGEAEEGGEDPFSNREKMKRFKKPVLFLHSHMDKEVPPSALEWLVCESRSKATQFQIVPSGSRRDIPESAGPLYYDMIKRFIDLRLGRRPRDRRSWRERKRS